MTLEEVSKLRKEKPREFDALVAEKVMGWERCEHVQEIPKGRCQKCGIAEAYFDVLPGAYHKHPTDDYRVLYHVREKWDENQQWKFIDALRELLRIRDTDYSTMGTLHLILFGNGDAPGLRVGDYAAAALVVMGKEKS